MGDHLVVDETSPTTHNMVVCTLCSCYPWDVLGLPPVWYKSFPYRSRAVKSRAPFSADFGVTVACVHQDPGWDSTAETRLHGAARTTKGTADGAKNNTPAS